MSTIIVIESRPLIRLGLMQLVSETLPGSRVDAVTVGDMRQDSYAISVNASASQRLSHYHLMLLSIDVVEGCVHQAIATAQHAYRPESILLLSDKLLPWPQNFCAEVIGCIPLHAQPEFLQASIRQALPHACLTPLSGEAQSVSRPHTPTPPLLDLNPATLRTVDATAAPSLEKESKQLGLTPRQYEVLVLLARGYTLKAIAQHLNIAAATAKVHAETVYQKLHVHNRAEAIYAAISSGATLGWHNVVRDIIAPPVAGNVMVPPGSG